MVTLPKWSQMLVYGKDISESQALEIIRRTDDFFVWNFGGNDKNFNEQLNEILKRPEDVDIWREKWQALKLSYCSNRWVSSSFIYGPSGWCHPNGKIEFNHNIGKYPTVEEVYEDWSKIAKNFKFLDLNVILMSGESCEEGETLPLVDMKVSEGEVYFIEENDLKSKVIEYNEHYSNLSSKRSTLQSGSRGCYFSLNDCKKWLTPYVNKLILS